MILKVNFDGVVFREIDETGLGIVVRDHLGSGGAKNLYLGGQK